MVSLGPGHRHSDNRGAHGLARHFPRPGLVLRCVNFEVLAKAMRLHGIGDAPSLWVRRRSATRAHVNRNDRRGEVGFEESVASQPEMIIRIRDRDQPGPLALARSKL